MSYPGNPSLEQAVEHLKACVSEQIGIAEFSSHERSRPKGPVSPWPPQLPQRRPCGELLGCLSSSGPRFLPAVCAEQDCQRLWAIILPAVQGSHLLPQQSPDAWDTWCPPPRVSGHRLGRVTLCAAEVAPVVAAAALGAAAALSSRRSRSEKAGPLGGALPYPSSCLKGGGRDPQAVEETKTSIHLQSDLRLRG